MENKNIEVILLKAYYSLILKYDKLLEECQEFIEAYKDYSEYLSSDSCEGRDLIESIFALKVVTKLEIADIIVVAMQLYYDDKNIRNYVDYKIERTLTRIKEGYYANKTC